MPGELPHRRGKIAFEGIGFVAEVESFSIEFQGDPEPLLAIDGTVGALEPKGKGVNVTGTLFVPVTTHAYSKIIEKWYSFTRVTFVGFFGNQKVTATGRFNAPTVPEDGTRVGFTFVGFDPKIETV